MKVAKALVLWLLAASACFVVAVVALHFVVCTADSLRHNELGGVFRDAGQFGTVAEAHRQVLNRMAFEVVLSPLRSTYRIMFGVPGANVGGTLYYDPRSNMICREEDPQSGCSTGAVAATRVDVIQAAFRGSWPAAFGQPRRSAAQPVVAADAPKAARR